MLARFGLGLALSWLSWGVGAEAAEIPAPVAGDPAMRGLMQGVFQPVSQVLPLSFDAALFAAPANREFIRTRLAKLAAAAGAVEAHAATSEHGLAFVAGTLKSDAVQLSDLYRRGNYADARYVLHNMTDDCIACHTSLPERHKAPPAAAFFTAVKLDGMPDLERAYFLVMSRHFDEALGAYERHFLATDTDAANRTETDSVAEYLRVSLQVKGDFSRARTFLERLASQPDRPRAAREQLSRWAAAVRAYEASDVLSAGDLGAARRLLDDARSRSEFPFDRDGLVQVLLANAVLHRYVQDHPTATAVDGEAYYLMAVSEAGLGRPLWVSREERDLEAAIRLSPGSHWAAKAMLRLEDDVAAAGGTIDYRSSDEIRRLMAELRQLLEASARARVATTP